MEQDTKERTLEFRLDVLVRTGENVFVAQCLQFDIAVQAPTMELLRERFAQAFAAHLVDDLEAGRDAPSLPQAPKRFWDMYLRGGAMKKDELPIYVPSTRKGQATARATFAQYNTAVA